MEMVLAVKVIKIAVIACLFAFPFLATNNVSAHPGRTDAYGGHNCYVGSCAGTYHYHNGGYVEDDYYDQGYEFGNNDALDNNHDYITSTARSEGNSDGYEAGSSGESEEFYPDAPDWICDDVTFDFRANEYEDYISGVYDGFVEGCRDIANDSYSASYSDGYAEGYSAYEDELETEQSSLSDDDNDSGSSSSSSGSGWVWLAVIGGIYGIPIGWAYIKDELDKRRK